MRSVSFGTIALGALGAMAMGFSTDLAEILRAMVHDKSDQALQDWKMIAIAITALTAIIAGAYGVVMNTHAAGTGLVAIIVAVAGATIAVGKLGISDQKIFQSEQISTALYLLVIGIWVFWAPLLFRAFRQSPAAFAYFGHIGVLTIVAMAMGGVVQYATLAMIWPAGTGESSFIIGPMGGITTAAVWGFGTLYWNATGAIQGFTPGDKSRWTVVWALAGLALCFGYGAVMLAEKDWAGGFSRLEIGIVTLALLGAMLASAFVAALVAGGLRMSYVWPLALAVGVCAGAAIEWAARKLVPTVPGLQGPGDPAMLASAWWWTQAISMLGTALAVWIGVVVMGRIARAIGRGAIG